MSSPAICSVLENITKPQDLFGNRFILYCDGLRPYLGTRAVKPGGTYSFISAIPDCPGSFDLYFPNGSPFGPEERISVPFNRSLTISPEAEGRYNFILRIGAQESMLNLAVSENGVHKAELRWALDRQWRSCIRVYKRFAKVFFDTRGLSAYRVIIRHLRSGKTIPVYSWRHGYFALVPTGSYRVTPEPKLLNELGPTPDACQTGGTDEADLIVGPDFLDRKGRRILSRPKRQTSKTSLSNRVQFVFKDTVRVQKQAL